MTEEAKALAPNQSSYYPWAQKQAYQTFTVPALNAILH